MKQPIKVTVEREHGNSGDVILTMTDPHENRRSIATPGEQSPYGALAGIRPQLEEVLNEWTEPKDGTPFCVVDVEKHEVSVMLNNSEIGRVPLPPAPVPVVEESAATTPHTSGEP